MLNLYLVENIALLDWLLVYLQITLVYNMIVKGRFVCSLLKSFDQKIKFYSWQGRFIFISMIELNKYI